MKKIAALVLCACLGFPLLHGAETGKKELRLIENGKSAAAIVLPDKFPYPAVEKYLLESARALSEILAEGTGAKLPVIRERALAPGRSAILLGDTAFARSQGVDVSKMKDWEAAVKVAGNRLILAGPDHPASTTAGDRSYFQVLSSVRAMTEFLQRFAGVRFLIPGKNGIHAPRLARLAVPAGCDLRLLPRFKYVRRRPLDLLYEIANGYFSNTDTFLYGGHSYYYSVPVKKYWKSHPEYFRFSGATRSPHGNHLCISNPEVQELMLKEMAAKCDEGFDFVQLAQTDGYTPCECKNCRAFGGTDDEGEKLWILHRSLAERFMKLRPGKKVLIISYGPTANPPKTFTVFPRNTAIELCRNTEADLKAWRKYTVPQGFTAYLYNWGPYQGLLPKCTFRRLEDQVRSFVQYNVKALYLCGIGELYGLEGPQYYVFKSLLADPGRTGREILREYCEAAFGEAKLPMEKFYAEIDGILSNHPVNNGVLKRPDPRGLLPGLFIPSALQLLEQHLAAAEKLARAPKVKARLKLVRTEFDFLCLTVRSVVFYNAYRFNPNRANFAQLEQEVTRREALLDRLFGKGDKALCKRLPEWPKVKIFGFITRGDARKNGTLTMAMGAPFDWDFKLLRKHDILPFKSMPRTAVRRAAKAPEGFDFDKGEWAKARWVDMKGIQLAEPTVPTRFKLLYDRDNLYVGFDGVDRHGRTYLALGQDGVCWGQDAFEIMLDVEGTRATHYHFLFNFVAGSRYDARNGGGKDIFDPDVNKPDPTWNGKWSYQVLREKGRVRVLAKISFASFPVPAPVAGTVWTGNFGREEYHDGEKDPELLLWAPNPEARNFHDRDKFGELIFE